MTTRSTKQAKQSPGTTIVQMAVPDETFQRMKEWIKVNGGPQKDLALGGMSFLMDLPPDLAKVLIRPNRASPGYWNLIHMIETVWVRLISRSVEESRIVPIESAPAVPPGEQKAATGLRRAIRADTQREKDRSEDATGA